MLHVEINPSKSRLRIRLIPFSQSTNFRETFSLDIVQGGREMWGQTLKEKSSHETKKKKLSCSCASTN